MPIDKTLYRKGKFVTAGGVDCRLERLDDVVFGPLDASASARVNNESTAKNVTSLADIAKRIDEAQRKAAALAKALKSR